MRKAIELAVLFVCGGWAVDEARANPPTGVVANLLSRGTYEEFKVKSENEDFEFRAKAEPMVDGEPAIDVVVRQHDYAPHGDTGWHTHPGPVFITVKSGTLTFYEYDDPKCTPIVVTAGQGYVDTGRGHIARNETDAPATDVTVIIAPATQPGESPPGFRGELNAPQRCPM